MDPKDRERIIQALLEFETSFVVDDPDVGKSNYWDTLLVGCKGYHNMTDDEIQSELDDAVQNLLQGGEDLVEGTELQAVRHLARVK